MESIPVHTSNVTPPPAYSTGQGPMNTGEAAQPPPMVYPTEPPPKYDDINGPNYGGYQAGTYPSQNPNATYVYTQGPAMTVLRPGFGQFPVPMQCQYCQANITTSTVFETGALTWLASGMLCLFGCWLGCCLIPFCISDLQDVVHQCPNCQKVVGVYRRMG